MEQRCVDCKNYLRIGKIKICLAQKCEIGIFQDKITNHCEDYINDYLYVDNAVERSIEENDQDVFGKE